METQNWITISKINDSRGFVEKIELTEGIKAAYDFDGVICEDCPKGIPNDKEKYIKFLRTAKPLYLPHTSQIPMIITGRHEQYRKVTMDWLEEHGLSVDPKKLIMRPFEKDDNIWVEQVSLFKGGLYKISNFNLFIESSLAQSERIKDISKKPVFCPSFGMLP